MDPRALSTLQRLRTDFPFYAANLLKIRTKLGEIQPFCLNVAQRYVHKRLEEQLQRTGSVRALVLKGRQQGISTYTEGRYYWRTSLTPGLQAFILCHDQEGTSNIFSMARRYHEMMVEPMRPWTTASNAKELVFSRLNSGYRVGTAGSAAVGRGQTLQLFHGSEVGFWPNAQDHLAGVMQAVPTMGHTEIILESTANGIGNVFHEYWQEAESGRSDFQAIFIPWYWQPEYTRAPEPGFVLDPDEADYADAYGLTLGQMAWRRAKLVELRDPKLFRQEYPASAAEAFVVTGLDAFISSDIVARARRIRAADPDAFGPLILGVDPARFGPDRSTLVYRRGRRAFGLEHHQGVDTMELAGIVAAKLTRKEPDWHIDRAFIDVGGLGAGVVDRLHEMGFRERVRPVNFGGKPADSVRFKNRRSEMWGSVKDWLEDEMPVQIPDDDSLHADLVAPSYKYDSANRMVLEAKEDMKKRGLRSPDGGDALALTFAEPVVTEEMQVTRRTVRRSASYQPATVGGY